MISFCGADPLKTAAILNVLFGNVILVFGVVDQITYRLREEHDASAKIGLGIWTGLSVTMTGSTWLMTSRPHAPNQAPSRTRVTMTGSTWLMTSRPHAPNQAPSRTRLNVFYALSMVSLCLASMLVTLSSITVTRAYPAGCEPHRMNKWYLPEPQHSYFGSCVTSLSLQCFYIIAGGLEMAVSLWSVVLCIRTGACRCSRILLMNHQEIPRHQGHAIADGLEVVAVEPPQHHQLEVIEEEVPR
ncbi:predicted protein [Nematostella vectensis]|uniref:Uncharacterized protein n=1 Tax=Nematostella vectensis TaxID=45351 RepID=A7T656_NEMVE|nr:predicted protein [Nematostella vectensis]|eukprot:XP_001620652.1 hypothetical protein NEMVEDRAFT_v1g248773 [Nematostella vectensis]